LDAVPGGPGTFVAQALCPSCAGSAKDRASVIIRDLVFGDVVFCSGQSNAWLPLWFTFERNESTAKVAAGAYDNLRLWRGGLGKVSKPTGGGSGNWVGPKGVEPPGSNDGSDALTNQWRHPKDLLSPNFIRDGEPWLWEFPSTCFYTVAYLTDLMRDAGQVPPFFGIMTTPVGGTMVEEWSSPETQATVKNVTCMCAGKNCPNYDPLGPACVGNSALWYGNIQPFLNLSLSFHLYYQGENNLQYDGGNSAQNTGYASLFPAMIRDWRAAWSSTPGTTDPLAPFGFVTLADGTDEAWGLSMAGMRWAQMGTYGSVPNPIMPNTFVALGHDAGDPWDCDSCGDRACCVDDYIPLGSTCNGDHRGQWSVNGTGWFMGQVHPRSKGIIGRRLSQAAFSTVYGGAVPAVGPVLSGCSLSGATLTITFNKTLLAGNKITWEEGTSIVAENTALYVLASNSLPDNAANNHHGPSWQDYAGPYSSGHELGVSGWVAVNARVSGDASLTVDLAPLNGATPTAVRYATGTGGWGAPFLTRMCCGPTVDVGAEPCAPDSCPLHHSGVGLNLPGTPFVAKIVNNKCECLAPTTCDE
jgi:sialate O-acetylesterase